MVSGSKKRRRGLTSAAGFTLVELMLSTMILGLITGIAATNMAQEMPRKRLESAATQLAWTLRTLRLRAVSQRHTITVTFTSNHTYTVWTDRNDNGATDAGETHLTDFSVTYPGVTIVSSANPMLTSRGTVSNVPAITLSNGAGSKTLTLSVVGDVTIQ